MAATNAQLACDVLIDGVYSSTVQSTSTPSLAAGATEVKTINYTPTVDGDYDFRFYPMMDATDEDANNDTIYDPVGLVVDPTEMRRDDGIITGALGIGAINGDGGYLGLLRAMRTVRLQQSFTRQMAQACRQRSSHRRTPCSTRTTSAEPIHSRCMEEHSVCLQASTGSSR
jgi:hypothetical protein